MECLVGKKNYVILMLIQITIWILDFLYGIFNTAGNGQLYEFCWICCIGGGLQSPSACSCCCFCFGNL